MKRCYLRWMPCFLCSLIGLAEEAVHNYWWLITSIFSPALKLKCKCKFFVLNSKNYAVVNIWGPSMFHVISKMRFATWYLTKTLWTVKSTIFSGIFVMSSSFNYLEWICLEKAYPINRNVSLLQRLPFLRKFIRFFFC